MKWLTPPNDCSGQDWARTKVRNIDLFYFCLFVFKDYLFGRVTQKVKERKSSFIARVTFQMASAVRVQARTVSSHLPRGCRDPSPWAIIPLLSQAR